MTRRRVKRVDIADGLTTLAAATLAYLFAAALLDHWVARSGLGFWERFSVWVVMITAGGYYFVRKILPLLVFRISPVFAAHTIEQGWPAFKNSLINFLFLRRRSEEPGGDELARRVYQGLEAQAAAGLARVDPETIVDRSHLIRVGALLAGVVAVCCLYLAISPKNPLVSFGRVIWPWAPIDAPTRVKIDRIEINGVKIGASDPGVVEAYQGETVLVSAEVRGVRADEPVSLVYSSADGQSVDQVVPMAVPSGGYRYQAEVPPGNLGLQQGLVFYLTAGDCTPRHFRIEMQIPLAIVVDQLEYRYPAYTGLATRTVPREGDVRGLEGTEVTIRATANQEIADAYVEFDGNPRQILKMESRGTSASARLPLRMSREDPAQPEHTSYQLRFTDAKRRENRRPIRHRIEVIPDLKPAVRFLEPPESEVRIPEGGLVDIKVQAQDPDFGLRRVAIRAQCEGKREELKIPALLSVPRPQKAHQGLFEGGYRFEPAKLGLKGGDRVSYWAEALDNKEDAKGPAPNAAETEKRWIVILSPAKTQEPGGEGGQGAQDRRPAAGGKPDGRPDSKPQPGEPNAPPQAGPEEKGQPGRPEAPSPAGTDRQPAAPKEQSGQPEKPGQPGEEPQERIDGQTNPGEAVEKILRYREEQRQPEGQSGEEQAKEATRKQPVGEGPSDGAQEGPGSEQGKSPSGQPPAGPEKPAGKGTDTGQGEENKSGKPSTPGKGQGAKQAAAAGQQEESAPGQPQGAGKKTTPGKKNAPVAKTGTGQGAQQPSGEPQGPGEARPAGEKMPAGEKPGEATPDQQAAGQKQGTGEKTAAGAKGRGTPQGKEKPAGASAPKPESALPDGKPTGAGEAQKAEASPGAKGGEKVEPQRSPDNEPGSEKPSPGEKPDSGKGAQAQGAERKEPGKRQDADPGEPGAKGGDPKPSVDTPGAGQSPEKPVPTPSPQDANRPRERKPGDTGKEKPGTDPTPPSPSTSPKTSDCKSDEQGDRSGGGGKGGGQSADKKGAGDPGKNTSAEQGGSQSAEQGKGQDGTKAGQQAKAESATGKAGSKGEGQGKGEDKQPGEPQGPKGSQGKGDSAGGRGGKADQQTPGEPGKQGSTQPGGATRGNPEGGGIPGERPPGAPPPEGPKPTPDDPNLDYARKRTNLALRTLEEELAKEKPELLERLGWTRSDAERFLRSWEQLRKEARDAGPRGEAAQKELDRALRSLGLRQRSTQSAKGRGPADQLRPQDVGRFAPPPEWADLIEAYSKGISKAKP